MAAEHQASAVQRSATYEVPVADPRLSRDALTDRQTERGPSEAGRTPQQRQTRYGERDRVPPQVHARISGHTRTRKPAAMCCVRVLLTYAPVRSRVRVIDRERGRKCGFRRLACVQAVHEVSDIPTLLVEADFAYLLYKESQEEVGRLIRDLS